MVSKSQLVTDMLVEYLKENPDRRFAGSLQAFQRWVGDRAAKEAIENATADEQQAQEEMSMEEFNRLLNGPLGHPLVMFRITRLTLALSAVVQATGKGGADALWVYCAARDQRDADSDAEIVS